MATQINLTYCGMGGAGKTVKEAKQDAARKIEAVLDGHYFPRIITYRGNSILVYRTPQAWHTTIIVDDGEPRQGVLTSSCMYETESEAASAAQLQVAQLGWKRQDGYTMPDFLTDKQKREMHTMITFWMRYQDAKAAGMNDHDAHDYAWKNPGRPELWAKEIVTA